MILTLDCGLSAVKVTLATPDGDVVETSREPHPTIRGHGRAEQDPDGWMAAFATALGRIERAAEAEIVVPTGHMHALVAVDADGVPVLPCLTLQDRRGAVEIEALDAHAFHAATGQTLDAALPVAKLLWMRAAEPELLRRTRHVLAPKDFIGLRLTGAVITDPVDAGGYGLYDPRERVWRPDIVGHQFLDPALLPAVRPCTDIRGELLSDQARTLGLRPGTPVLVGAGDDVELLAATGHQESHAVEHIGTTGAIVRPLNHAPDGLPADVEVACTASDTCWSASVSTTNGGAVLDWAARTLGVDPLSALAGELREDDPIVRPRLWPERGRRADGGLSISGLRPDHGPEAIARAFAVAVAYELRRCAERVVSTTGAVEQIVTSGGSSAPDWLQLRSDVYGRPLRQLDADPTALGCVTLGMVALGAAPDVEAAAARLHREAPTIEPDARRATLIAMLVERAESASLLDLDIPMVA